MEEQAHHSPKEDTPKRRRRPPLSCVTCRRRKLKCDRCSPCSQCIKSRAPNNCTYVLRSSVPIDDEPVEGEGSMSGGDGPRAASMERNLHVFHAKSESSRVGKNAGSSRADELRELRDRVTKLESALAKTTALSPLLNTPESLDDGGGRGHKGVAPMVDVLPDPCFRGTNDKTKYVGRSNYALSMYLFHDVGAVLSRKFAAKATTPEGTHMNKLRLQAMAQEQQNHQRVFREHAFKLEEMMPTRAVADQLLDLYLATFETTYRILHVPTFRQQYETYWATGAATDTAFLAKLYAAMATSSCFYSPTIKLEDGQPLYQAGARWLIAVQSWVASVFVGSKIDMDMLQVLSLLSIARQTDATEGDVTFVVCGSLARSAMVTGLNRDPSRFCSLDKFWAEQRRRLWASIIELELQSAVDAGMVPGIDLDQCDISAPTAWDDADLKEGMTEYPNLVVDVPSITRTDTLALLSRSLPVRLRITRMVNNLRFTLSYDEALRLSDEILRYLDEGTALYKRDEARMMPFARSFYVFTMRRSLLVLHRPFCYSALQTPKYTYSRKVCLESSMEILSLLEENASPHLGQLAGTMFQNEFLHAAISVCIEIRLQLEEKSPLTELVQARQNVMLRAVRRTVDALKSRLTPDGKGCKAFTFISLIVASVEARMRGDDAIMAVKEASSQAVNHCREVMNSRIPGTPAFEPAPMMDFDLSTLDFSSLFEFFSHNLQNRYTNRKLIMSTILSTLGLRAAEGAQSVPNHAAGYLIANYLIAFGLMSTRGAKVRLGLDHNAAPREDLTKYGEAAVQSGKISRATLNRLKRQEAAHANSMEGFSFFVGAVLLAVTAGVPAETINGIGLWYTVSRVAFAVAYAYIESGPLSYIRSVFWWSGNASCITALVLASKKL